MLTDEAWLYNANYNVCAVAGMQLAGAIVKHISNIISINVSQKPGIQFGAYASFLAFIGLAELPKVSDDFTGVVDYAGRNFQVPAL
ncbi:hypothetical protein ACN47E_001034 [Coniothyrium glycines]